ncbi:MAG TPA: SDR family NAD(P)-dependent oxidoreductase [Candidatus Dormibacteraeota bacterium]|nr:SDR family NAD(P)-dependent oxidoreductase [Candidatus Dormibacteraeota bacterium]
MKLQNRTVLITGGISGIGFELAKQLSERGNTIIITGRDQKKLNAVKEAYPVSTRSKAMLATHAR